MNQLACQAVRIFLVPGRGLKVLLLPAICCLTPSLGPSTSTWPASCTALINEMVSSSGGAATKSATHPSLAIAHGLIPIESKTVSTPESLSLAYGLYKFQQSTSSKEVTLESFTNPAVTESRPNIVSTVWRAPSTCSSGAAQASPVH